MKCMARNRQKIWYAALTGETKNTDSYGFVTGERTPTYSASTALMINVSAARGEAGLEQFGSGTDYSHTLVTDDLACPIDENSVLWIGRSPEDGTPHNFAVVRVARSLNSVAYAVREVKVSKNRQTNGN
ncbi:MAG: hypothetical protein IKF16_10985 [Lachnospiraceae bacterium]|nr:hypothetical protein [Lachnospiraceae bacterium]